MFFLFVNNKVMVDMASLGEKYGLTKKKFKTMCFFFFFVKTEVEEY
jgi:hypothetical protein